MADSYPFPVDHYSTNRNVGLTHWIKAGLWKGLQGRKAPGHQLMVITNGLCGTAHVQVATVAYCSILYYFPIFHIFICAISPKNACCRLTTLFCFETNIYLRVCLTFATFVIVIITEVSNSLNCWPNAIHVRRPRGGQLGRSKRRRKFLRTGKRAPGRLLLTKQFYDSCGCLSSIYSKNPHIRT